MSTCPNRVGFRRNVRDITEYIVLPESFRAEIIKGFFTPARGGCASQGRMLQLSDGKNTTKRELPGMGRIRPTFSFCLMKQQ